MNCSLENQQDLRSRAEDKLRQAYAELEMRVQERTAELSATIAALTAEIAERKQAQRTLLESEEKYRQLFELESDAIFLIDNISGEIFEVNSAATKLYGYSAEELLAMRNTDLSAQPNETQRAMSEKHTSIPVRYHRKKNGTVFPVEITASHIVRHGRPCHIASIRDITERKRLEAEKTKSEVQYRQIQKAESLGRMAGAIAHLYNNLLGAVLGNLELAMDDLPRGSGIGKNLSEAMKAARRAAEVSGLMLTYLGQTPGKQEPLDLSEACRQSLSMLRALMPKELDMETDLPCPGPTIKANVHQMQQILNHLVTNAWEAIGEGGGAIRLAVKTVSPEDIPETHRRPLSWQPMNQLYACLEVTDSGCGIMETDIDKIFDPFFTSKFTGRGLGLPVILGIVRSHGGVITMDSEVGRGSSFRIFLPVSAGEVPRMPEKTVSSPEVEECGTMLLVEDDPAVRRMAKIMLERLGCLVLEANDGMEAVEMLRMHKDTIRCVLCDLTMPRMDGWETLTALRRIAPGIPVILSSGYDRARVMTGDHPEWPQAFLGKPYRLMELREAIRHAMENKRRHFFER